jgi:hypothetical protein
MKNLQDLVGFLMRRLDRMRMLKDYFFTETAKGKSRLKVVSQVEKENLANFNLQMRQGKKLTDDILNVMGFTSIRSSVENFMISNEELVVILAVQVRKESCELIEILDEFIYERYLIMNFLNDYLSDHI